MLHATEKLLREISQTVIRYRGVYRKWAKRHNVNYHEMLIFYSLNEESNCTQMDICNHYALPKQTVNNIISTLNAQGYIDFEQQKSNRKAKYLRITESGKVYSERYMELLRKSESEAVNIVGLKDLQDTIRKLKEYVCILDSSLNHGVAQNVQ